MTETETAPKPPTYAEYQRLCIRYKIMNGLSWEKAAEDVGLNRETLRGWAEKHKPKVVDVTFDSP